jgi:hypothetical protein
VNQHTLEYDANGNRVKDTLQLVDANGNTVNSVLSYTYDRNRLWWYKNSLAMGEKSMVL